MIGFAAMLRWIDLHHIPKMKPLILIIVLLGFLSYGGQKAYTGLNYVLATNQAIQLGELESIQKTLR